MTVQLVQYRVLQPPAYVLRRSCAFKLLLGSAYVSKDSVKLTRICWINCAAKAGVKES
jgi:hypothetical protein